MDLQSLLSLFLASILTLPGEEYKPEQLSPMLDSLDRKLIDSALAILRVNPRELGFDKLWADDDTFRLDVVEYYLNNPLKLPDYVDSSYAQLTSHSRNPMGLLSFVDSQLLVTSPDGVSRPLSVPEVDLPPYDPYDPFKVWKVAIERAEPYMHRFYGALDSLELHDLMMAAPVMWSEAPDSINRQRQGEWQRAMGLQVDTTREVGSDRLLDIMKKLDLTALFTAGKWVVSAAQITARGVSEWGVAVQRERGIAPAVQGEVRYWEESPWGWMVIGGEGKNLYWGEGSQPEKGDRGEFSIVIDLGGNDLYYGRMGGGMGGGLGHHFSAIIDLKGDDFYSSQGIQLTLGAGFLGVGVLIDREGDDTYLSDAYSQGAGLWGIGVLADHRGQDIHRAGFFTQGAGHCGFGYLLDNGDDDDLYFATAYAQGFGGTFGYGLLLDEGGDDVYRCGGEYLHQPLLPHDYRSFSGGFGMGWRPRAGGGIGVLIDRGVGNDFYDGEVMSFGSSYWYSLGILIDDGGNDRYSLAHYGLGSGIHLSLGAFYDRQGDDQYRSRMGVVGGTPHDLSVGIFVDGGGNDSYGDCDGWGGSLTNSVGIFIDRGGDDTYFPRKGTSLGRHNWARDFAGIALFIDREGADLYPQYESVGDSSLWNAYWGVGMDLPYKVIGEREAPIPEPELTKEDSLRSIEELFKEASQWEVGSARASVKRARKALRIRPEAPRWAIEHHIGTKDGLVLRALEDLLAAFPDTSGPLLMTYLDENRDRWTLSNAAYLLGVLKWEPAAPRLIELLGLEKTEKSHRAFIQALGKICTEESKREIVRFFTHPKERNRLAAIAAAAQTKDILFIPYIIAAMNDSLFTVRSAALRLLTAWGSEMVQPLVKAIEEKEIIDPVIAYQGLTLLAKSIKDSTSHKAQRARRDALTQMEKGLKDDDGAVRAEALRGLYPLLNEKEKDELKKKMKNDPHPLVRSAYREVMGR